AEAAVGPELMAHRRRAARPRPGPPPRSQHFWSDGHRQDAARAPHSLETFPRAPGEEVLPGAPQRARGKRFGPDRRAHRQRSESLAALAHNARERRRQTGADVLSRQTQVQGAHASRIGAAHRAHTPTANSLRSDRTFDRRRPDLRFDGRSDYDETRIEIPSAARGAAGLSSPRDR